MDSPLFNRAFIISDAAIIRRGINNTLYAESEWFMTLGK